MEYTNGTGIFPNNTVCGGSSGPGVAGFWLSSGEQQVVEAKNSSGIGFNGALTGVLSNNEFRGARYEINFSNLSHPFWDVDYQLGISDGTCGPPNSKQTTGERHALAKANKAWKTLNQTMKKQLIKFPQYLKQDEVNKSLTYINMGVDAWPARADVIEFFQVTADFQGYVGPGSVTDEHWPKHSMKQKLVHLADLQTKNEPGDMVVVASY